MTWLGLKNALVFLNLKCDSTFLFGLMDQCVVNTDFLHSHTVSHIMPLRIKKVSETFL